MTDEKELIEKIAQAIRDTDMKGVEIAAARILAAIDLPSIKSAAHAEALEEAASHLEQVADFIFERLRMGRSVHQVEGQSIHDLKREASAIRALVKAPK